jgi:hypothetical protein
MVEMHVRDDERPHVRRVDPELFQQRSRVIERLASEPPRRIGVEPRIDDDRPVGIAHHPEKVLDGVGLRGMLVLKVGIGADAIGTRAIPQGKDFVGRLGCHAILAIVQDP